MKTCSDSLKALLHQYRTGERRTWYIADLYTIWLSETDRTRSYTPVTWQPYFSGSANYANGRFGLGLYANRGSETEEQYGRPLIRIGSPAPVFFDWAYDDWTIEFFVRYTGFLGYMGAGGTAFAVTNSTNISNNANSLNGGFSIGGATSAIYQYFTFHTIKDGVISGHKYINIHGTSESAVPSDRFTTLHIAVVKKGNTIYSFLNGKKCDNPQTIAEDEELYIPPNSYWNIEAGLTSGEVVDEFRISYGAKYISNFTVPTSQFTADGDTLVLLHFNGNLNDEGYMQYYGYTNVLNMKEFNHGEVLLYTGHDTDLRCGGNKYKHIAIEHGDIEESRGLETATMDLTINYNPNDTISPNDSRTWLSALKNGTFDNAYISLDRLYSPIPWRYHMPNIPIDYVLKARFYGRMDIQEVKLDHATIQVKSPTDMLSKELPRNLVKPSCLNHFGDFMCQMNPMKYQKNISALSGSNRNVVMFSDSSITSDYNNGMIISTSGRNKGQCSSIKEVSSGQITTFKPFMETISVGDTFVVMRGCDKTMKMCRDTYDNLLHFRGFPFLPYKNVLL